MGLDLKYIFANQPPVLPDFSSLPQKHIADLFKLNIIKSYSSYYWHKYKEIGLSNCNSFTWFHELTHAIEANIFGHSFLAERDSVRLEDYVKLEREIIANKMAIELCERYSLPIIAPTEKHLMPQKTNDVIRARLKHIREFIKRHEIFYNS